MASTVPSPSVACSTRSPAAKNCSTTSSSSSSCSEAGEAAAAAAPVDVVRTPRPVAPRCRRAAALAALPRRLAQPPRAPAAGGRRPTLPLDEVGRDLVEEARREVVLRRAPEGARPRVHQVQPVHGARDAHVGQAPLLLHVLLVERALVREDALLHAGDEHHRELEALGVVQRHQRDERARVGDTRRCRRTARSPAGSRRGWARRRACRTRRRTPTNSSRFSRRPSASSVVCALRPAS